MMDNTPVIIVGAPRSGTSLLQRLLRDTPGFVSVPRESDMIWMPHCHPSNNSWRCEGCPDSRITDEIIRDIQSDFRSQAISSSTWRLFDRFGLMEKPRLAAALKFTYRKLFKPWKRLRESVHTRNANDSRLVDKSVHAGLWLNLVDSVFPTAKYIHLVRSPEKTIPSMIHGWSSLTRFQTYQLPSSLVSGGEGETNWWCFPMPPRWEEHYNKGLVDICIFQWTAIQESILNYISRPELSERYTRIHLEALVSDPRSAMDHIASFLDIDAGHFRSRYTKLPIVNASGRGVVVNTTDTNRIATETRRICERLK